METKNGMRCAISSFSLAQTPIRIGSSGPASRWTEGGVVLTGAQFNGRRQLETNCEGVFAIGDVRAGSMKRVAAAVGEGAQVVAMLHEYIAESSIARQSQSSLESGVSAVPRGLVTQRSTHA